MLRPCRLISCPAAPAAFNMGLDEALVESVAEGLWPLCLRFYSWSPPAVSIGYFQGLHEEVNVTACRDHGVDIVRRITGGGAVFHQTELTYSFIAPNSHELAAGSLSETYQRLCGGLIAGFSQLGIKASFAPINDILVDGLKISGNAQTRRRGCLLQHGTILIDLDVDLMFDLLQVPVEKTKGKLIQDLKARLTSLRQLCTSAVDRETIEAAMRVGFAQALGLDYQATSPTAQELSRAQTIMREKYDNPAWTALK